MTRSEQRNRSLKARAIADTLTVVHCDADTATALTPEGWRLAAQAAAERTGHQWTDASEVTQAAVVAILFDREAKVAALRHGPAPEPVNGPTADVLYGVVVALVEADGGWEPHSFDPGKTPERFAPDPDEDAFLNWCDTQSINPDDHRARSLYTEHLDHNDLGHLR